MSCRRNTKGCGKFFAKASNLADLFKEYLAWRKQNPRDDIISYAPGSNLNNAIKRAAWGKRDDDKCHSHQRRFQKITRELAEAALSKRRKKIQNVPSFSELMSIVREAVKDVPGNPKCGELYVYDAALRIGRVLKIA